MSEETIEALCERCGETFHMFLREMADKNLRVVCPRCAALEDCADGQRSTAGLGGRRAS